MSARQDASSLLPILLAGLIFTLIFYYPILLYPQVYDFRDMPRVLLPFEHMVRALLQQDPLPLWNPMGGLGKPLFADPLSGLAYPPHYISRMFLEPFGWNLSIAAHHFISFFGAFLFLRKVKLGGAAATVGAVSYSFGGYLVSTDNMLNALQSVSWFPWVFWAFFSLLEGKPIYRPLAFTALFVALSFLGGMPEVVGYELVLLVLFAFFPVGIKTNCGLGARLVSVVVIALLSFGLSAVLFLPLFDFLSLSTRSAGLDASAITELSFAPRRLFEFIYPFDFLSEVSHMPWTISVVMGPVLIFLLPALLSMKARVSVVLFVAFALFLAAAMGTHLPGYDGLVEQYQILRMARHPEKFLLVLHAILAFAIAYGYHNFLHQRLSRPGHVLMVCIVFSTFWFLNSRIHSLVSWESLGKPPLTYKPFRDVEHPVRIYADGIGPSEDPMIVDYPEIQKALFLHHFGLFYGLNNVNAPSSLNLASSEGVVQFIESAGPERLVSHLGLFSISHVTSAQTLAKVAGLVPLGYATKVNVFAVPNARPRMYLPQNVLVTSNKEEMHYTLPQVARHRDDAIVYSPDDRGGWRKVQGELLDYHFEGDKISFEVQLDTPGFVVINDAYHPDWKLSCARECDGKILLANSFVRAVSLPPGRHQIELLFEPASVTLGALISGIALLTVLGLLLLRRNLANQDYARPASS